MGEYRKIDGEYCYNVYVILLDDAVANIWKAPYFNPNRDPAKPCVYVGATIYDPEKRFEQHKSGHKASWYPKTFGIRLMPELYEHLNPLPQSKAFKMEEELAGKLRKEGYTVFGGH
jgi:predicted GIY-YIG superfamily endonuclease